MKIITCVLFLFFSMSIFGQQIINTKRFSNLKGEVAKVIETHYTAKLDFGEVAVDKVIYKLHGYLNEDKSIVQLIVISDYETYQLEYNSLGIIKKIAWAFDEQEPQNYIKYTYEDQKLLEVAHFVLATESTYSNFTFNTNVEEVEGEYILKSRVNYQYNDIGRIVREDYFGHGSLDCIPYHKYYEILGDISEIFFNYSYVDCSPSRHLPESYYNEDNNSETIVVGKYTTSTEEVRYSLSSQYREYEYDDKGNWIKCTYFSYEQPIKIVKRKITYE